MIRGIAGNHVPESQRECAVLCGLSARTGHSTSSHANCLAMRDLWGRSGGEGEGGSHAAHSDDRRASRTWVKVTSLNTKSPARSRALRVVSTYAEECGTTPYDLFRALSHHEISAYPASHTGKQTGDSSLVPCFWHSRRPKACSLAPDRACHSRQ